jgi:DNA-binding NarL/FixJ family response regulator
MLDMTVLIVDDHALFRSGLSLVLATEFPAIEIFEAGSIHDAIHAAVLSPSVILLDIALNGLNGLDGIALLKRQWPAAKIIMLSSDTSLTTAQLALQLGAVAFVTKAETAKKIISVINAVVMPVCENSEITLSAPAANKTDADLNAARLTARQYEVLDLVAKGLSNKVIAKKLGCTENTVRGHVQAILAFFNVTSRTEAAYAAKVRGIIQ